MLKDIKYHSVNIAVQGKLTEPKEDDGMLSYETSEMIIKPNRSLSAMEDLIDEIYKKKDEYFMDNATDPEYLVINSRDYKVLVWYLANERRHISLIDNFIGMEIIIMDIGIPKVIGTASEELMNLYREGEEWFNEQKRRSRGIIKRLSVYG